MMSEFAIQLPYFQDNEGQDGNLDSEEIFIDSWISQLKLEYVREYKFGPGTDVVKRRVMTDCLIHLSRLQQIIRLRKRQPSLPGVDSIGTAETVDAPAMTGSNSEAQLMLQRHIEALE